MRSYSLKLKVKSVTKNDNGTGSVRLRWHNDDPDNEFVVPLRAAAEWMHAPGDGVVVTFERPIPSVGG